MANYTAKNDANPGLEHSGTWKVAYNIPGIKDWMFYRQTMKALRNCASV